MKRISGLLREGITLFFNSECFGGIVLIENALRGKCCRAVLQMPKQKYKYQIYSLVLDIEVVLKNNVIS